MLGVPCQTPKGMPLAATNVTEQAALLVTEQERDISGYNNTDIIREVNDRLRI
jgi:hypothetical protein